MDLQSYSRSLADILDAIPSWNDESISIVDLCKKVGAGVDQSKDSYEYLVALLKVFDSISIIDTGEPSGLRVKSISESATYFLKSLAMYLREDRRLISNWERTGINKGLLGIHDVLSGPQFLYIMENNRIANKEDAIPIRKAIVVKAIIKARIRGSKEPVFLVQFDEHSRQFQLIGGHQRKTDADTKTALIREIGEELNRNVLRYTSDYDLRPLATVSAKELSSTYGVYTEYEMHYFQVAFKKSQLIIGPNDRWLTLNELLSCKTKSSVEINESAILNLDNSLPGGLRGLELSLNETQRRTVTQLIKDHPWETAGIILSVIGILLSVVFFVFS